jgi:hypothetical protein
VRGLAFLLGMLAGSAASPHRALRRVAAAEADLDFEPVLLPPVSTPALATGALAVGALAVGALAIGALAIGRLEIRKARFRELEVGDLTVRRFRIIETTTEPEAE